MEIRVVTLPVDELAELAAGWIAEGVRRATEGAGGATDDVLAIVPSRLYTQPQAAALLGFGHRPKTLSEIPEADLPRCKVGPARGSVRYLGADLLAYAKGLAMPDTRAMVDGARDRVVATLGQVSPVRAPRVGGRRRVR